MDKGRNKPAGMATQPLWAGEAVASTVVGPVLRKAVKPAAQDDEVPVRSFMDDLKDKISLRSVMPKRKTESVEDLDELPDGGQYAKEDVNYRYAEREEESCGNCVHFLAPGSCEIVAGLIRAVDVCDLFEPNERGGDVVQATIVNDQLAESGRPVEAEIYDAEANPQGINQYSGGGGGGGSVQQRRQVVKDQHQQPSPKPSSSEWNVGHNLGPTRGPDYDNTIGGQLVHRTIKKRPRQSESASVRVVQAEVAPPGWEPTVLQMKKHPEIDNPFALAWSMKNKGYQPGGKKTSVVLAEMVTMSSLGSSQGPSGLSGVSMVTRPAGSEPAGDEPASP